MSDILSREDYKNTVNFVSRSDYGYDNPKIEKELYIHDQALRNKVAELEDEVEALVEVFEVTHASVVDKANRVAELERALELACEYSAFCKAIEPEQLSHMKQRFINEAKERGEVETE